MLIFTALKTAKLAL